MGIHSVVDSFVYPLKGGVCQLGHLTSAIG
jgi:hypothetical protein